MNVVLVREVREVKLMLISCEFTLAIFCEFNDTWILAESYSMWSWWDRVNTAMWLKLITCQCWWRLVFHRLNDRWCHLSSGGFVWISMRSRALGYMVYILTWELLLDAAVCVPCRSALTYTAVMRRKSPWWLKLLLDSDSDCRNNVSVAFVEAQERSSQSAWGRLNKHVSYTAGAYSFLAIGTVQQSWFFSPKNNRGNVNFWFFLLDNKCQGSFSLIPLQK